jgi:ornithine decarboxylase
MDLQQVRNRYNIWNKNFPNVKMHYAVKSNPDKHLLRELVTLGSNFDCASMEEIRLMLELGATPDRLIFANPVKSEQHIEFAKTKNVKIMTFDCVEEARKIKKIFPDAELLLRIAVEATDAPSPMTKKFGAPSTQWNSILDTCQKLDLNLRGVSFHVGSGGCSVQAYKDSIQNGKKIFEMAI